MADFLKEENNNFIIQNGDLVLDKGSDEVFQRIQDKLRSYEGEWFLDDEGIPYFDEALRKGGRAGDIEALISSAVSSVVGVQTVKSIELYVDTETRDLYVDLVVSTIYGDTFRMREGLTTSSSSGVVSDSSLLDLVGNEILDLQGEPIQDLRGG